MSAIHTLCGRDITTSVDVYETERAKKILDKAVELLSQGCIVKFIVEGVIYDLDDYKVYPSELRLVGKDGRSNVDFYSTLDDNFVPLVLKRGRWLASQKFRVDGADSDGRELSASEFLLVDPGGWMGVSYYPPYGGYP